MSDRVKPVVPTAILDAAERAVTEVRDDDSTTEPTLRDVLRAMLGIVLPMYEDRLGAELGRLMRPCADHQEPDRQEPNVGADCFRCGRYAAFKSARRVVEGRGVYAGQVRRAALKEAGDAGG